MELDWDLNFIIIFCGFSFCLVIWNFFIYIYIVRIILNVLCGCENLDYVFEIIYLVFDILWNVYVVVIYLIKLRSYGNL